MTEESTPPESPQTTRSVAHLGADAGDRLVAEGGHRPVAAAAGDLVGEVLDQPGAVRGVHHLGVELDAVEAARIVGDGGEGGALGDGDGPEARRQRRHPVAVAHPDGGAAPLRPDALEQAAVVDNLDAGAAELTRMAGLDPAAELGDHRLLAVADAEDRHARFEDSRIRPRCVGVRDRCGAARENDRTGIETREKIAVDLVEGMDLANRRRLRGRACAISCVT